LKRTQAIPAAATHHRPRLVITAASVHIDLALLALLSALPLLSALAATSAS
jgi:hypothetical protein